MSQDIDVTDLVKIGYVDDDITPLLKCVCGHEFAHWTFLLSIYREPGLQRCQQCGRAFYFSRAVRVFEIVEAA